jgi:hypothetical protein
MTRDRLEDAFLRLRAAAHADEYVPMEDVIKAALTRLKDAEEACEAHEAVEAKLRKERFEEIAKADKLVVDLNEVTNALSAAHTREAIARAAIADRDRRLDQIAAAAALVQTTVQQYFDQHGPSCDEHSDEPDHTCPTCCIDIDASGAISGLKFWSKP